MIAEKRIRKEWVDRGKIINTFYICIWYWCDSRKWSRFKEKPRPNTTETEQAYSTNLNKRKAEVIVIGKQTPKVNIKMANVILKQVKMFNYSKSIVTSVGQRINDIKCRLSQASINKVSWNLETSNITQCNENILKNWMKSYVWRETWTVAKRYKQRMEAFEMWCWRRIKRISWETMKSSVDLAKMKRI